MNILKSVLEEELERNIRNQKSYEQMLSKLPKGSIYIYQLEMGKLICTERIE